VSADNFLQGAVGTIGEFYEWLADRLNDDAARAEVLIDLGLPPTIAVGQAFPQHQIKGINGTARPSASRLRSPRRTPRISERS
jgi:hypothetical protein